MSRLIGQHYEGDVRVSWYEDAEGAISIQRSQDVQEAIERVAAINSEGAPTLDGLGKPVAEVPTVLAMEWAQQRGIPWEKLLYSNEYDDEFLRFAREYSRLCYDNRKSVHAVQ